MSAQIEQLQTIEDFLKKYPVTIDLTEVPENPHMEDSLEKMINYFVVLKYSDKVMSLYFSTGLGWVETRAGKSGHGITYRKRDKLFLKRQGTTVYDANSDRMLNRYQVRKPKVSDILDCLASDASGIDQTFEEWARDLGYDTDSRKAEETYKTCRKQAQELKQMLGASAFNELLDQTERM